MPLPGSSADPSSGANQGPEIPLVAAAGHDGVLREVTAEFARLLGLSTPEIDGRSLLEFVDPEDLQAVVVALAALENGAPEVTFECRLPRTGTMAIHLEWTARPLPGTDGWSATGRDTTEFHRLLADRDATLTRLDLAIGTVTAAKWALDLRTGALSWEPQIAQLLGCDTTAVPASFDALAAMADPGHAAAIRGTKLDLDDRGTVDAEFQLHAPAGTRHLSLRGKVLDRDWRGRAMRAVGLILDVSNERAAEEQTRRLVMTDALTGAANRRAFDQTFDTEGRRSLRARQPFSVLMIDIDNFKQCNDTFGHPVGDEVLQLVASTLAGALRRAGDFLARFGGEEFAIALPNTDVAGAVVVSETLVHAIRNLAPAATDGWQLSISVGSATWTPDAATEPAQLVGLADEALYQAKTSGKNRAVSYERSLAPEAELERAIEDALAAGEFCLQYQPVVDLAGDALVGFEAVLRWVRPGAEPADFFTVAERSGLICDLDRWALGEATRQLAVWSVARPGLFVAVNTSGRYVGSSAFPADVTSALAASGLQPCQLQLELTETMLADSPGAAENLAMLREGGVQVAIDDFGTGLTSLAAMSVLPADTLKLGPGLVASDAPRDRALVAATIAAAHAFGLQVVAQGISDPQTAQRLRDLASDRAQGQLFA